MSITKNAEKFHERMFPEYTSEFLITDPEFIERFDNFTFDEVIRTIDLEDRTRFIAILTTLLGSQSIDEFRAMVPAAINFGFTPIEIKEVIYQSTAYLGIGRVFPFLKASNEIFEALGISLPLPSQATTTTKDRLEKGNETLVAIVGPQMQNFATSGPRESQYINRWLTENCFGDYYTRSGLTHQEREMITFCFLLAQGGCENQLTSHSKTNMRIGNDNEYLIKIISQVLPFIGYPRSLNALACVNAAEEQMNS